MSQNIAYHRFVVVVFLFPCLTLSLQSDTISTQAPNHVTWSPPECPSGCSCVLVPSSLSSQELRTVNCTDLNLDLPPMNISGETEAVILSGNRLLTGSLALLRDLVALKELRIVGCRVHSLEDLTLAGHDWSLGARLLDASHNVMTHLHNRSFINLIELESLVLANNLLETIHPGAFYGLGRLTSLNLSGNRLLSLADARWLCHIRQLRRLDLRGNSLHVVPNLSFRCLPELRWLDLSRNRIRQIDDDAFSGLDALRFLSVEDNSLPVPPSDAIGRLTSVEEISLSGNLFQELLGDSFRSSTTLTSLRLNRMSELQLIDRMSFRNLTSLELLELRHNRRLKFIHHRAFEGLSSLKVLDLENCALETLDADLVAALPSLMRVHLRSNPLVCDCTLSWLVQRLRLKNETGSGLEIVDAAETRCQLLSAALEDMALTDVPLDQSSGTCGPRIVPLFAHEVQVPMAESTRLQCRAVGVPRPRSFWIQHAAHDPTQRNKTEEWQWGEEVLTVESTSIEDQGVHVCEAVSASGHDERIVLLHVHPLNTTVLVLRLTVSSITVTWRGTDHVRDYSLTYRKLNDNSTSVSTVPIKHYMRSFTASELPPETGYEFCVGIRRPATNHFRPINCTVAATRNRKYAEAAGLRSLGPYVIVVSVAVVGVVVCLSSTVVCSTRIFDRTKRQLQEAASVDHMSEMFLSSLEGGAGSNMASETYENEAAESAIFDEADLDEIRNTAYMNAVRSP